MNSLPRCALVRRPGPRLADGLVTHLARSPIDVDVAMRQWDAYVAALNAAGWATVEVAPCPEHPDAVFIEDAVVVFDDVAVVTRPGAHTRRGETSGAADAARAAGLRIAAIEAPATLDGGDVLKVGRRVLVGLSGRTNAAGVAQLAALLSDAAPDAGWEVVAHRVERVLHLKSAITALPDGTIIGHPPLVDDVETLEPFLAMPEAEGAHVVVLDRDRLMMSAAAPRSAELLRRRGYRVELVDISEFEKLEGCVTCLSVRIRR